MLHHDRLKAAVIRISECMLSFIAHQNRLSFGIKSHRSEGLWPYVPSMYVSVHFSFGGDIKEVALCRQNSGCGNCIVPQLVAHTGSVVNCGIHMFRWAPLGFSYSSFAVTLN